MKAHTLNEFWESLSEDLAEMQIEVTLVGGGVATIYTGGKYESGDLDFIYDSDIKKAKQALLKLGFEDTGKSFSHPDSSFTVEFVGSFIEIGEDANITPVEYNKTVKILNPTDCVKDRLASYIYHESEAAFDAACIVIERNNVCLREVYRWSLNEGKQGLKAFKEVCKELKIVIEELDDKE
jgi:hypothetical protein